MAIVSADGFDSKAAEYGAKAEALDPKLVEAHEFMANLDLENQKIKEAGEEADRGSGTVERSATGDGRACGD